MRRWIFAATALALLLALGVAALPAGPASAQASHCFTETNQCLSGRFLQYWEQNGGLPVFGFPITPARSEKNTDDGKTYTTQWFERNRFELHPENQPPYDVLLGRLGAVATTAADAPDLRQRESGPKAGCLWFAQTGFNVCNNAGANFASYWQTHGLANPSMNAYDRSLALFGLPLSRQVAGGLPNVTYVQYFERARFEWHPNEPEPYKVLLGLLGTEQLGSSAPPDGKPLPAGYDNTDTSVTMLASFYNAINVQEYQRAYNYWQNPPSSYAAFVSGYANTASVQLIVQPPTFTDAGAGNLYQQVPTALIATGRDGSVQQFTGCYITHKSNLRPPDIPKEDTWHINQANLVASTGSSIPDLLARACPDQQAQVLNNAANPIDLLASFYNAINQKDYQRAYSYWQNPPVSYAAFVSGYANTASVQLLVNPPGTIGAAAGSAYTSLPTVLVATQRDGSRQLFSGCYVTRKSNVDTSDPNWHLYSASIAPAAANASIPALLAQPCNQ